MTTWRHIAAGGVLAALLAFAVSPAYATDTVSPMKPEPVLVLKSFKLTPASLSVGDRFKLELLLDDVVDVKAENVVVTLGASAASPSASAATSSSGTVPEVVVLGTNTRFLGTIAGMTTNRSVVFDLVSNPKGFPGPFSLPVTIQSDSPNGGRITSVQSVGLMFTRTLVFDVGSLTYPREVTAGKPFNVSVTVKNTNDFPVNGVALSFDSTAATWVSRETTIGVLEPGKEGRLVATAIAQEPGVFVVTMSIAYRDDYNQTKQIQREITLVAKPRPDEAPAERKRTSGDELVLFLMALLGLGG